MTKSSKKTISTSFIPQSNYRKMTDANFTELDTTIVSIGNDFEFKDDLVNKINYFIGVVHFVVFGAKKKNASLLNKLSKMVFSNTNQSVPESFEGCWTLIEQGVINHIKVLYLDKYADILLVTFEKKLSFVVNKYKRYLPQHITLSEGEDLTSIAQLELIETIKAWNPIKTEDMWPLAYSRVNGAMKDHIRYISKADPSRFYDWVTDAAQLYLSVNNNNSIQSSIENSSELDRALNELSAKEKQIVN